MGCVWEKLMEANKAGVIEPEDMGSEIRLRT